ncbi:MAG: Flp pilus assembly complex ATPase component TadA [Magnetococcales bacterium]|nr:Flp pilus assembly complex ATPase component TadA [Magnetococcales bacterium]MBF0151753.1 Flp pilus assembly complex ATPase component TadA [Magnetococcales bacterium]MBF0173280.1 Flp pilus assembly complex ATPase component TadA [Magnetococcales bacterium]MBF0346989.1 Flp pilus assembly complex ATPase component TadA [Magnetococcales bacterium]MBF0631309.1 Flp pilus assembly complex ATPase component TadA [Magnetococcales bacterium]
MDTEPAPKERTDDPTQDPPLAPSDRILAGHSRFIQLNHALQQEGILSPERLTQLLGCRHLEDATSLLHVFLASGLVSTEAVQQAKEGKKSGTGVPLWKLLFDKGIIGQRTMAMGLAITLNLPYTEMDPGQMEPAAVQRMDGVNATHWEALPVRIEGEILYMACADPKKVDLERAEQLAGLPVRLCMTPRPPLLLAIDHWYGGETRIATGQPVGKLDLRGLVAMSGQAINPNQPVTVLLDQLIINAVTKRASDIHIVPEQRFLHVHFRIDGRLFEEIRLPLHLKNPLVSRIKVVAGMDIAEKRLPQDGHIQARLADRLLDIRVSDVPSVRGETIVMRLLDLQVGLVPMEQLGFAHDDLERFRRNVALPHGLILVTGPTGSGKSTTLRAALDYIVRHQFCHLLTVEDPVEVRMDGVTQVQVNNRIGFTFPRALRQFLRHDPDVIMVGEIRDAETAKISVQAALTGHRVFSTLHTNDAPGAVTRLVDMGVEPFLVSSAVSMVIAQRLVRRLCPACRSGRPPTPQEERLLDAMATASAVTHRVELIYESSGCPACNHTGHVGRTVIYEMLTVDEEMKQRIARNEATSILRRAALNRGFEPLVASGRVKVVQGITALGEVAPYLEPFMERG